MLPSIIDVAQENCLTINPRSLNKKEVYAKCPFCNGEKSANQYKLSMNTENNVFKCWLCKASGGVLEFESRLTNRTFQEVRVKYFGDNQKKRHYVEYLSPKQLRKIGWNEYKRKSREDFIKKRDDVLRDWRDYEYSEKVKYFALFMVVAHIDDPKRTGTLLEWIMKSVEETGIYCLFSTLLEQFILEENQRTTWAKEGTEIARMAWKCSLSTGDNTMQDVVKYVLLTYFLSKNESENQKKLKGVI
ncbi:hypothetical protein ACOMCU_22330 [Lysinibacillus sp. UGB7]|uniref:hypothetical protein n=1 Tax=Lysinibacillus sp. UGB7 TaxID=3411039 RepID=UPI003B7A1CD9